MSELQLMRTYTDLGPVDSEVNLAGHSCLSWLKKYTVGWVILIALLWALPALPRLGIFLIVLLMPKWRRELGLPSL